MRRQNISRSDLGVAYSSYYLIKSYKLKNNSLPSGLYFNKALSYINTEIKKLDENIKLPHSWYRWGDEVVRYYMPHEITWSHEEASHTKVDWKGGPPILLDDKLTKAIKSLTEEFLNKYPIKNSSWYEELLADHYEGAPFEFQREYKSCRDLLFDRTRLNGNEGRYANEVLIAVFKSALEKFPRDRLFHPVRAFAPTFLDLISYPLSGTRDDLFIANDISEEFWYWFSYFLRVHPRAHENIGEETVTYWKSDLEHETFRFYQNFDDHVAQLSTRFPDILKDDLLKPHLQKGRRRLQEWEKNFKDFEESVEGLDDFLSSKVNLRKDSNN